jgi:hypothetical protein
MTCDSHILQPALQSVLSKVRDGLNVASGFRAELHNLLVYEPGGHFKPHRDSEKVPGMFGTLVVNTPFQT